MSESNNSTSENAILEEEEQPLQWLIRPCEMYKEEYSDCTSIRARFHQYFIFGETIDCSQWKIDYDNCYLWDKYKDKKAYNHLVESEKQRRIKRLKNHYDNNVWERRDKPPENWNAPLPEWLEQKSKTSYLRCVSEKMKSQPNEDVLKKELCTIM